MIFGAGRFTRGFPVAWKRTSVFFRLMVRPYLFDAAEKLDAIFCRPNSVLEMLSIQEFSDEMLSHVFCGFKQIDIEQVAIATKSNIDAIAEVNWLSLLRLPLFRSFHHGSR